MREFKIELGKHYLTNNGLKATVVYECLSGEFALDVNDPESRHGHSLVAVSLNGFCPIKDDYSIVAEWVDEPDYVEVPILRVNNEGDLIYYQSFSLNCAVAEKGFSGFVYKNTHGEKVISSLAAGWWSRDEESISCSPRNTDKKEIVFPVAWLRKKGSK
jgi:hypothetical protein